MLRIQRAAILALMTTQASSSFCVYPTSPLVSLRNKSQHRSISTQTGPLAAVQYLLKYEYVPDVLELRGPFREEHLALAQTLIDEGSCLAGGPTGPVEMTVPTGALFTFTDAAAAKGFVEKDPYVANGIVTSHSIEEWNVVVERQD